VVAELHGLSADDAGDIEEAFRHQVSKSLSKRGQVNQFDLGFNVFPGKVQPSRFLLPENPVGEKVLDQGDGVAKPDYAHPVLVCKVLHRHQGHGIRDAAICPQAMETFMFHRLAGLARVGSRRNPEDILAGDHAASAGGAPRFEDFQGIRQEGFRGFFRSEVTFVVPEAGVPAGHSDMAPDAGDRISLEGVVFQKLPVLFGQEPERFGIRQSCFDVSPDCYGEKVFRAHHRAAPACGRIVAVENDGSETDKVLTRLANGRNGESSPVPLADSVGFLPG
jgi:hypothetical protein